MIFETNTILLIKLRSIFNVSSDRDLSMSINNVLNEFARKKEQEDLVTRIKKLAE